MFTLRNCPVCNEERFVKLFECTDHTHSGHAFTLEQCSQCKLIVTNPRPENNALSAYYASEQYISHSNTSKGIINKLYKLVRTFTLRSKIRLLKKHKRTGCLLDIGCGAGYFLGACQQYGFVVKGVEPDSRTREASMVQFGIDVTGEESLETFDPKSFDIISMWHVLEHVTEPRKRMDQVHQLLKDDGIAIVALPNPASHDATYYGRDWAGYDVPRHLFHFTPEVFEKLMKETHFELFQTLPMHFDSFYVSMLSERNRKRSFPVLRGFLRGLISNIMASFNPTPKYSSQIYLLRKAGNAA